MPLVFFRLLFFAFCLSSCESYHTAVYNDPLYRTKKTDPKVLESELNAYSHREITEEDSSSYKPKEGEVFEDYHARLVNTLILQERNRSEIVRVLEEKEKEIERLTKLERDIISQHIDMRLSLHHFDAYIDDEAGSTAAVTSAPTRIFHRYYVRKGDTLQKIAKRELGSYSAWLSLYRFNRRTLENGPNRIEIGQLLLIPDINERRAQQLHRMAREIEDS